MQNSLRVDASSLLENNPLLKPSLDFREKRASFGAPWMIPESALKGITRFLKIKILTISGRKFSEISKRKKVRNHCQIGSATFDLDLCQFETGMLFLRLNTLLFNVICKIELNGKISSEFSDVQLMQDELGIDTDGPLLGRKYTFFEK